MAKLPTRDSLGPLPQVSARRNLAQISTQTGASPSMRGPAAMARGISDIGDGIAAIGKAAEAYRAHELKQQEFDTERKYQEFEWGQKKQLDQTMRDTQPGQARDLPDTWQKGYVEQAKEFFKDVPDQFKAQYEQRLFKTERDLYGAATTHARTEQKRFGTQSISDAADNIYAPRARVTQTDQLDTVAADQDRLIDANPDLTPIEKDQLKRAGRAKIAEAHVAGLPVDQRLKVLGTGSTATQGDAVVDRIIGVESGGDPNAKNPNSSATGAGQFIKSTWLSTIKESRPDLAAGKSDAELLDMRSDRKLSREMTKAYADKNSKFLRDNGIEASPQNVYLAHFLGPDGARKVISASPDTPVANLLGKDAIDANRSVLEGKTAGAVQSWAGSKMAGLGRTSSVLDALPYEKRVALQKDAQTEHVKLLNEQSSLRSEQWERKILDASVNPRATLPARTDIENDPTLNDKAKNTVLRQYDTASKDVIKLQSGLAKFADANAGPFNPFDSDEKKLVDNIYRSFGGNENPAALSTVVSRTNMLPASALSKMRGDLASNDPQRVAASLTSASNLLTRNNNILSNMDGASGIEDNAVAFRHYVDNLGMTADDAAKRIIRDQSPEYQASVKAKLKTEDVDQKIKKELSINDLAGAFDQVPWVPFTDPSIGFDPATRQTMYAQYAEQVKDRYLETGDWSIAKKQAASDLKKTWGVTNVNGKSVVMQYPPERAPAYAGIENPSEMIASQAQAAIKEQYGVDAKRSDIRLMPIPGVTASEYKSGQPPRYMLAWTDKNGNLQMLNPGQAFFADPKAAKAEQSEARRGGLESGMLEMDEAQAARERAAQRTRAAVTN